MAKAQGKGVFVGAKIKVGFPKFGQKKDGTNWQLFTYKESKKNVETGEFDELGRYTIFVNNPQSSLQNGDLYLSKQSRLQVAWWSPWGRGFVHRFHGSQRRRKRWCA